MLGNILGNFMESHLGLMLEHSWDLLYKSLDGSNDGRIEGLFIGSSLGSTDDKLLVSDEVIKMGSNNGKVIVTILGSFMESHLGLILEQRWVI